MRSIARAAARRLAMLPLLAAAAVLAVAAGCDSAPEDDPTQHLDRSDYRQKTEASPYRQPR